MKESEKLIDRKLGQEVKKIGGLSLKLVTCHMAGLPDRLVLLPGGVVVFVELKTTGDKPRLIQKVIHKKLRKLGFKVLVIDNKEDLNNLIKESYGTEKI